MKTSVKTLVFITTLLLVSHWSGAQLKLPALSGTAADVKKVIQDYPGHFAGIKGDLIAEHPQSTEYQCTLKMNGAEESTITRHSSKKEIYSWQAVMLTTESFDKAKQKFRSLFTQLNNLTVQVDGAGTLHFKGTYEQPSEERKFTSVLLTDDDQPVGPGKLVLEISLQYQEPMEWKVKIILYDKERGDEEKGAEKETR
ncbi:MAG: hypothetical protein U0U70_07610 [Chitinophagaceae bacterium]